VTRLTFWATLLTEYIATLEGEVATRDQQIQVYKEELSTTKSENNELKKEIERLRKAILEGRTGNLFDKAAANEASTSTTVLSQTNTKTRNTRSSLAKANRNKDLPSTGSRNGFWGGPVLGGGATPVHTTLIPDFDVSTLSGKPKAPAPLQENLNPLLNSKLLLQADSAFLDWS
jgi:cell division protein FtsB